MGKIDTGCAGCHYLTEHTPARCMVCRDHDGYVPRRHRFGVDKELEMLGVGFDQSEANYIKFDFSKMVQAKYDQNISDIIQRAQLEYRRRERRALEKVFEYKNRLKIEKVIFNDPATIVYWRDGSKTVVKAEGEVFDPEKGLAMAISKKALGNEGNYYEVFKEWVPKDYICKPAFVPVVKLTVNGPNQKEIDNAIQQIIKTLSLEEKESYVRNINGDDVDSGYETLPYVGNKTYCDSICKQCCPVDTNNKRKAGKVCKESCCNYKKHFNN